VAGAESPRRLQSYVGISGWTPVDARLHVSNVADLARKLGGEQLYGDDPAVPLRELIQNASDAVRARRVLENRPSNWGRVTVRLGGDEEGSWIEVEDTGIGMSEAVLTGPLLDFGTTYWGSALMREEHEGLWARGFEPTGRFGIGFFSLFMWGERVRVTTRQYDDNPGNTRILEFRTALEVRPLVRFAPPTEQIRDGGTRVRVWLKNAPDGKGGLLAADYYWGSGIRLGLGKLCASLAPAIDVDLYAEDGTGGHRVVAASDWLTIEGAELLSRTKYWHLGKEEQVCAPLLRIIKGSDGRPLGRAMICRDSRGVDIVTVGGLRIQSAEMWARGVFVGTVKTIARDKAAIIADSDLLKSWASEQAKVLAEDMPGEFMSTDLAPIVLSFGGDIGALPIAVWQDKFLNREDPSGWESIPDEIGIFAYDDVAGVDVPFVTSFLGHIIKVPGLYTRSRSRLPQYEEALLRVRHFVRECIARAWQCAVEEIEGRLEYSRIGIDSKGMSVRGRTEVLRKPLASVK
jgi:histidine kinase/DNA gyrase B/HSP90-like ATPase